MTIVNNVSERDANEIIVFLANKGVPAEKTPSVSSAPGGGDNIQKWSISVAPDQATEAMSILNQNGLPRKMGTNLLDLFAKSGLMSSEKEETIRYQAGLAEQIGNTIRKIDGVIDADVQLSFPPTDTGITMPGAVAVPRKITAAIYVKHQGILDDPNSHLIIKIKRLVAGSVAGLDINDVTVISDRSRFTDYSLSSATEPLSIQAKEYVSIWSIVMNKSSAARFRVIFFLLIVSSIVCALIIGWMIWKFYPLLRARGGFKSLLKYPPLEERDNPIEKQKPPEEGK